MVKRERYLADAAVAAVILAASVAYFVIAGAQAAGATQRDLIGQAGFPRGLAILAMLGSTYILVRALLRWRVAAPAAGVPEEREQFSWRPIMLWLAFVFYIVTLDVAGFWVGTPVLIVLGMYVVGYRRPVIGVVIAIVATAVFYALFDGVLNVNLPNGEAWSLITQGATSQ